VLVLCNSLNYIVLAMGHSLRRLTALILPLALLSLFSACLGLCAEHVESANVLTISVSESDSCGGEDFECCPVTEGQSLLREGVSYAVAALRIVENPFYHSSANHDGSISYAGSFSSPSPPLTLLGTLRI
jgi:hypothetical protein